MTRLIDADELAKIFAVPTYETFYACYILSAIKDAPTVDAEKVVRCGLCVWFRKGYCLHPAQDMIPVLAMHFCGYGERREGD